MNGLCAFCKSPANFVCERCNIEIYCSVECQKVSFSQHRFVCFQLPGLRLLTGNEKILKTPVESSDNVANECSLLSQQNENKADNTQGNLVIDEPKKHIVKPIATVKSVYKENDISEKSINMTSSAKKSFETKEPEMSVTSSKAATPAFNQGPRSTPPVEINKKVSIPIKLQALNSSIEAPSVLEEKMAPPAAVQEKVVIDDGEEEVNIANLRKRHQQTTELKVPPISKPPRQQKKIFYSDLKVRELIPGKHKVLLVNASTEYEKSKIFYVMQCMDECNEYIAMIQDTIKKLIAEDKTTSYIPEIEEMILAKYEGEDSGTEFYRAVVVNISPDSKKFNVFFVDYGNHSEVTAEDIRPFSPKVQMEIIMHEIFIENFPQKANKKVQDILMNEKGFDIEVSGDYTEQGSFKAKLLGL